MQLIFIEDSMYLPSVYFQNEIVFDCVKLPKMWFSKAFFFFLWPKNSDMEINYDDAPEADSSSFVEIKLKKKKSFFGPKAHTFVCPGFWWKGLTSGSFELNEPLPV